MGLAKRSFRPSDISIMLNIQRPSSRKHLNKRIKWFIEGSRTELCKWEISHPKFVQLFLNIALNVSCYSVKLISLFFPFLCKATMFSSAVWSHKVVVWSNSKFSAQIKKSGLTAIYIVIFVHLHHCFGLPYFIYWRVALTYWQFCCRLWTWFRRFWPKWVSTRRITDTIHRESFDCQVEYLTKW